MRRPRGSRGHPHRGNGHHFPRLDVRGRGGAARQAAARLRRAVPDALLPGDRRRLDALPGPDGHPRPAHRRLPPRIAERLPAGAPEAPHSRAAPPRARGEPVTLGDILTPRLSPRRNRMRATGLPARLVMSTLVAALLAPAVPLSAQTTTSANTAPAAVPPELA